MIILRYEKCGVKSFNLPSLEAAKEKGVRLGERSEPLLLVTNPGDQPGGLA
jgi:hypothetical protein